jgi:hypothetical protein
MVYKSYNHAPGNHGYLVVQLGAVLIRLMNMMILGLCTILVNQSAQMAKLLLALLRKKTLMEVDLSQWVLG